MKITCLTSFSVLCLLSSNLSANNLLQAYKDAQQYQLSDAINTAYYQSAQSELDTVRAALQPSLNVMANGSVNNEIALDGDDAGDGNTYLEAGYSLRWEKPIYHERESGEIRTANANLEQAAILRDEAKKQLVLQVSHAYFQVLRMQARLDAKQQELAQIMQQVIKVRKGYDAGVLARTEVRESEAQHAHCLSEIADVQRKLLLESEKLELLTKQTYSRLAAPVTGWQPQQLQPANYEDWEQLTRQHNSSIRIYQQKLNMAREQTLKIRSASSAELDWVIEHSGRAVLGDQPDRDTRFDTSLGVEFRLDTDMNGAQLAAFRSVQQKQIAAELELEKTIRNSVQQTRSIFSRLNVDLQRIQQQQEIIKTVSASAEATHRGFVAGTRTVGDYLSAVRLITKAQLSYKYAIYDYMLDVLELKANAGLLNESDLVQLNRSMELAAATTTTGQ